MAGKEGDTIDRGLQKWQVLNKFTLVLEAGAIVAGYGLGIPWLISLGLAGAAVDGAQIYGINKVRESRNKQKAPPLQPVRHNWSTQPSSA